MAGVQNTGFVLKTFEEIKAEIEAEQKTLFGDQFNTAADSVAGQLNGVFGDKIAELWEVAELIYRSQDPSAATGDALDNIGKITGTFRNAATATTVIVSVFSTAGTTVTAGDTIEDSAGNVYEASSTVVIPATTATPVTYQAQSTGAITALAGRVFRNASTAGLDSIAAKTTTTGSEPFNIGASEVLTFSVGGLPSQTVTISGPASLTAATLASEISTQLGNVTATDVAGTVEVEISLPNPDALANSIETISSTSIAFSSGPQYGSPANATDGSTGRAIESDTDYRTRRQQLLQVTSTNTTEAIRDTVAAITGVNTAVLIENETDVTDSNGLPPHSFEVVITSTFDQSATTAEDLAHFSEVATAIFNRKPVGIQTYTGATGADKIEHIAAVTAPVDRPQIFDSQGVGHDISYSVATDIAITDVKITISTDSTFGAGVQANGETEVKTALTNFIAGLSTGDDLIYNKLLCAPLTVTGVTDVTVLTFDITAKALDDVATNVTIDPRELLSLDSSAIAITVL